MGIYVSNMEMPECCAKCPMVLRYGPNPIFADYYCKADPTIPRMYSGAATKQRHELCPAQEFTLVLELDGEKE